MTPEQIAAVRESDDGRLAIVGFHRADGIHFERDELDIRFSAALAVTYPGTLVERDADTWLVPGRALRRFELLASLHGCRVTVFEDRP